MKRTWWFAFLVAVSSIFFALYPSITFAENSYIVFKPGIYLPQYEHGFLEDEKFDDDIALGAAWGVYYNKNIAAELEISYFQTKGEIINSGPDLREQVFNAFYNVKGIIPAGDVEIYGGGGIGVVISNAKINPDHELNTNFGIQVLGGAIYNIKDNLFVGMEGKYLWSSSSFQSGTLTKDVQFDGIFITGIVGTKF